MQGVCKLCGENSILEESHFIPKFVGKWVKKTSITGFIRESSEPARRAQDTAKEHWLCGKCEDRLSVWETKFANRVFFPFVDEGQSIASYESWMSRFCASLSWRTLTYIRSRNPNRDKPDSYYRALDAAEKHLADFLLGRVDNLHQYEQHLFPMGEIESTTVSGLPSNINRYFLRTLAMDIIGNESDVFIYTKLPCFIFLGVIKAKELNKLRSSRIAINSGRVSPRRYWWPNGFSSYLIGKAEEVTAAYNLIPQKDLDKFEGYIRRNPEKTANSKLFEAFLHDYKQFGAKVFS